MLNVNKDDSAVSPVIGVILLVAVTVALVALATVIVFDIGSDVSDTADATVQLEGITNSTGDAGMKFSVIRNENVANFTVNGPNGATDTSMTSVGNSIEMYDGTGTYSVVAELESGEEEVLTSSDR
jgi:flagellin-like protein